jgi:uncharacterized protein (TIGR03083 family)
MPTGRWYCGKKNSMTHTSNEPLHTAALIPLLDDMLIAFLQQLQPEAWLLPTIAGQWRVKDVAAHLLDGNIRGLSSSRDHHFAGAPSTNSFADITQFINQHNRTWVQATQHISSKLLIAMLQFTNRQFAEHLASLPPHHNAIFGVAWAGQSQSPNWLHIAREYTEKYIHQQQIRLALGNNDLLTPQFFDPFAHTSMYALPYTMRHTAAPENSIVEIAITAPCPGIWQIRFSNNAWQLIVPQAVPVHARLTLPPHIAWQLFSKGMSAEQALPHSTIAGDASFAMQALQMVAVMA